MTIDGRAITEDILSGIRETLEVAEVTPVVRAIAVAPSRATESYLRIKERQATKAGMRLELIRMQENVTTEEVIGAVCASGAGAVIVQLPLPRTLDTGRILNMIPRHLDADVLSDSAQGAFMNQTKAALLPPVVAAVKEVLERSHIVPQGRRVMVVGKGKLVGTPVAAWLLSEGADVQILTREDPLALLREADIVVLGAGIPHMVKPEHLQEGVVLIDAGTSESSGSIVGDADPSCAEVASVFTPVPGGIGPIAVACLFRNVAELVQKHRLQVP